MKNLKNHKKIIENNLIFVSTCSKNSEPHLIICAYCKVFDNKILITDNYMKITKKNILENNKVFLGVGSEKEGFLYIDGNVKYYTKGKYYDFAKSLKENKGYPCKGVLVVAVKKIHHQK